MSTDTAFVIYIGQDRAGRWLVQDSSRRSEGRFVSEIEARRYAREEGEIYRTAVLPAPALLEPLIPLSARAA